MTSDQSTGPIAEMTAVGRVGLGPILKTSITAAIMWIAVFLADIFDWGAGAERALVLVLVATASAALMMRTRVPAAPVRASGALVGPLTWICAFLVVVHLAVFLAMLPKPMMNDIGGATLKAGDALARGENPYLQRIDPQPEAMRGLEKVTGYKYMPLMALSYLPMNLLMRERGTLVMNLALDLLTAYLVGLLGRHAGGTTTGLFAAGLYLMVPLVPSEVLVLNVTDLVAVVPLLAAARLADGGPGWSGFCVGLSISTKLLPGAVLIPCFLPTSGRGRYATGLIAGLLPVFAFLAMSPLQFVSNTILFNAWRPADSTSWLAIMPRDFAVWARLTFVIVWLRYGLWELTRSGPRPTAMRCGCAVLCVIGSLVSAPINHRNYQLWWLPFAAVLVAITTLGEASNTDRRSMP